MCGVLALSLLFLAAPALAVPPIPQAFYGTVKINTADAAVGTVVSAKIYGENAGSYTTTAVGQYGNVATRDYLAVSSVSANDGDTITFYVSGVSTNQTHTFQTGGGPTVISLSITIPAPAGGGGGAAPAVADTTPPSFTPGSPGVDLVSNIGPDGATLSFSTDEPSTSELDLWASPGTIIPISTTPTTSHSIALTDLDPATTYHFKIRVTDIAGNLTVSDEYTFATLEATPTPAVTPTPTLTPTPTPTPTPVPGLGPGTWAGIAVGIVVVLGLGVWLFIRRR